jgi:hypothetical protein
LHVPPAEVPGHQKVTGGRPRGSEKASGAQLQLIVSRGTNYHERARHVALGFAGIAQIQMAIPLLENRLPSYPGVFRFLRLTFDCGGFL